MNNFSGKAGATNVVFNVKVGETIGDMKDNSYLCACQTNKGAYVSRSNYSIQYSGYLHCRMSLAVVGYRWALRGFHRGDFLSLKESLMKVQSCPQKAAKPRFKPPTNSPEGERWLTPGQSSRFKARSLSGNHTYHFSLVT